MEKGGGRETMSMVPLRHSPGRSVHRKMVVIVVVVLLLVLVLVVLVVVVA